MIKDQELAQSVLDALMTLQEAAMELNGVFASGSDERIVLGMIQDMDALLAAQERIGRELAAEDDAILLEKNAQCARDSLSRLQGRIRGGDWAKARHKLEFEFFPILQEAYQLFYYWSCVYPDPKRIAAYIQNERVDLTTNSYIDDAVASGAYDYDLSIVVIGYNKLEYTRLCVESIIQHRPKDLRCELILYNNGSSDGTKSFFESIQPDKQMDIALNWGAGYALYRIFQGEFVLIVSNDVIVTEGAIANMVRCAQENPNAAMIVPTTPNISNLQAISCEYTTLEEMHAFAKQNNQYDPSRHERRVRLCNPIALYRSAYNYSSRGYVSGGVFFAKNQMAFPDDQISLLLRRRGYALILQKDAFCHHFGSVTLKDEITAIKQETFYREGREAFLLAHGVDPWTNGFCFHQELLPLVRLSKHQEVTILGVNCGLGSDALKIKEMYREAGRPVPKLVNVTDEQAYFSDLQGISDECRLIRSMREAFSGLEKYHHILISKPLSDMANLEDILQICRPHLDKDGQVLMPIAPDAQKRMKMRYPSMRSSGTWVALS